MTQRSNHLQTTRATPGARSPRAIARALEATRQARMEALTLGVSLTALVLVVVVLITSPHGAG